MVRIEDNKIVIEVPTFSRADGEENWKQMTKVLFHLIQNVENDRFDGEERYTIMELLRAMLPKFDIIKS